MTREMAAAAVMVWLIGAIVGWCAGWAARGEQNRSWHRNLATQLAQVRAELAEALDQLDDAHAQLDMRRESPLTPAVHVHVATPQGWVTPPPVLVSPARLLDTAPALQAEEALR